MSSLIDFLVRLGTILMPIGLIGICIGSIVAPEMGEQAFGVVIPKSETNDNYYPFHFAAGIRDGALGIMGLLIRFKYPDVLCCFYLCVLLIPVGDLMIVMYYEDDIIKGISHILGAIGVVSLIILLSLQTNVKHKKM